MTKSIYDDLEPVENLIMRCEYCGDCFVEEEHLKNHIHQSH